MSAQLCHPLWEDVSRNNTFSNLPNSISTVILCERMWVEILQHWQKMQHRPESSSVRGCESKLSYTFNTFSNLPSSSVRGCESKLVSLACGEYDAECHPLWEDVSRNYCPWCIICASQCHPLWEDVSRNPYRKSRGANSAGHPLWEDVSRNQSSQGI